MKLHYCIWLLSYTSIHKIKIKPTLKFILPRIMLLTRIWLVQKEDVCVSRNPNTTGNTSMETEGAERPVLHLANACVCWGVSFLKSWKYFLQPFIFFKLLWKKVVSWVILLFITIQIKGHRIRFVFSQRRLMLTHSCPFLLLSTSRLNVLQIISLVLVRGLK